MSARLHPSINSSKCSVMAIDLVRDNVGSREKTFAAITIIQIMLDHISPNSIWKKKLNDLLNETATDLWVGLHIESEMGFTNDWRLHPFWDLQEPNSY